MEQSKKAAGEKATEYIEFGMTLGLGSGSTVYYMLEKLGALVQQGFHIKGVPTSQQTRIWAENFGIPLTELTSGQKVDLAIDGADEIDPAFQLIKGGGGCLVREKIVDVYANRFIVIADDSKMVDKLGRFPLPVEVLPFGHEITADYLGQSGCKPELRMRENGKPFLTDNGNYIYDCHFGLLEKPHDLEQWLHGIVGVVDTGLFLDMTDLVIVGKNDKVEVIETTKRWV